MKKYFIILFAILLILTFIKTSSLLPAASVPDSEVLIPLAKDFISSINSEIELSDNPDLWSISVNHDGSISLSSSDSSSNSTVSCYFCNSYGKYSLTNAYINGIPFTKYND